MAYWLNVFYLIGLPYETPEMFLDTVKMHAVLNTNVYHLAVFYPYKNTIFHTLCEKEGWITDKKIPDYLHESILDQPSFSNKQIKWFINNFDLLADMYRSNLPESKIRQHIPDYVIKGTSKKICNTVR